MSQGPAIKMSLSQMLQRALADFLTGISGRAAEKKVRVQSTLDARRGVAA
jgi:hypothetical protein